MCRRIALTLLALTALLIAGVAWLITRPAAMTPAALLPPRPPASPGQVHAAEERLQGALRSTPPPVASTVPQPGASLPAPEKPHPAASFDRTVRLSQDDLNTILADDPRVRERLSQAGVARVRIALIEPDRIAAAATVDYQGHTADVNAEGSLSMTESGELVFAPSSMTVGLLPLPQSVAGKFASQVDSALRQVQGSLPLTVERVRVRNRQIIFTGPAKTT